jgi:dephospho-CoA kinase
MLTIGLTGGIGSGKSLVAKIFENLGIPVFQADAESAKILAEDEEVKRQLTDWFGKAVYIDGKPDRAAIARIVFPNPEMLVKLNGVIHPKVMEGFLSWRMGQKGVPYVVHEAAILFESGFYRSMDATILVSAPEVIRISRVVARDKTTAESVRLRMNNQWSDEQKAALADYIINNDGISPLIPAILEIHKKLIDR